MIDHFLFFFPYESLHFVINTGTTDDQTYNIRDKEMKVQGCKKLITRLKKTQISVNIFH